MPLIPKLVNTLIHEIHDIAVKGGKRQPINMENDRSPDYLNISNVKLLKETLVRCGIAKLDDAGNVG